MNAIAMMYFLMYAPVGIILREIYLKQKAMYKVGGIRKWFKDSRNNRVLFVIELIVLMMELSVVVFLTYDLFTHESAYHPYGEYHNSTVGFWQLAVAGLTPFLSSRLAKINAEAELIEESEKKK